MIWDLVIGLEVHAQLKTKSKLFSGAATTFGARANSQTSFIDAGLPGVLPVFNQEALNMAIQLGLAIDAEIATTSVFERKNYFYPDLPKGYQISQLQSPILRHGRLKIQLDSGVEKIVEIERAHLEEDAGKSLHDRQDEYTGIDLNRAGVPLIEIVTTPCLYSSEEAIKYLKTLHQLLRFLGICDGSMQEGSFRCDVNLSLKPKGESRLGTRTELKNLNSFRFIEKAIEFERLRHQDLLESGRTVKQETRLYNPDKDATYPMRSKENEHDYRYFPDPDLLPIQVSPEQIEAIRATLPELPEAIEARLKDASLQTDEIQFILSSPALYDFYQNIKKSTSAPDKLIFNWLKGPYLKALHEANLNIESPPVSPALMGKLLDKLDQNQISSQQAKQLFLFLWQGETDIEAIITREGYQLKQDDSVLEALITEVLEKYPEQAREYQEGKDKLLGFFVGQLMKKTQGKASAEHIGLLLRKRVGR